MLHPDLLKKGPLYLSKRMFRNAFLRYRHYLQGRVLDIGCGQQPFKQYFNNQQYIGIDFNIENKPYALAIASYLPFRNNSFNSIICAEVLEHVPEPAKVLEECYRISQSEGILYITVPMTWRLHYEPHDYYRYTQYGIKYLCEKAGFTVMHIEKLGGLYLFLYLRFARFMQQLMFYIVSPVYFLKLRPAKIATYILIPMQLIALPVVTLLDKLTPYDARNWLVLAKRSK